MKINLSSKIDPKIKVLSGREFGKKLRKEYDLNNEDSKDGIVEVLIGSDVFSMTSSCFLGMFGKSVRKLGEKQFRKKYIFTCEKAIKDNIDIGINDALKLGNALEGE